MDPIEYVYTKEIGTVSAKEPGAGGNRRRRSNVAKTLKTGLGVDTNPSERQANKDNQSADDKTAAKQPEAKQGDKIQHQTNQSEDAGGWDRLTVQAQKEEAVLLPEPGGIEPR